VERIGLPAASAISCVAQTTRALRLRNVLNQSCSLDANTWCRSSSHASSRTMSVGEPSKPSSTR